MITSWTSLIPDSISSWITLISILSSFIGGIITNHILTPYLKEKYKLHEYFFVEYRKWCTDVSGEVLEFQYILDSLELCKQKKLSEPAKQIELSNNYIIGHFWEIHNTIRMGHKWIGKVEKDYRRKNFIINILFKKKRNPHELLHEFIDFVDVTWHQLENDYIELSDSHESEIEIYSYFLYLSGVLYLIKDDIEQLENLKRFFEKQIQNIEDNNLKLFLKCLKVYLDIINPKVPDITVFNELKDCLSQSEYHDDIIFNVIEVEYNMILKIIESINGNEEIKARIKIIKERVFPKVERKYISKNCMPIIRSLMISGLARLYLIAGKNSEHKKRIEDSLIEFPNNSFAILEQANLLVNQKHNDEEDLTEAEKKFYKVIKLIEDENQFKDIDSFNYRIKLEAVFGLAYIAYLKGLGKYANKKYQEAYEIIEKEIKTDDSNKKYLKSILLVNRGRNKLDNLIYKVKPREKNGKKEKDNEKNNDDYDEFNQVIEIYNNAEKKLKDELAEVAIIAYNNLGIYYLNEGLYEEAEEQLKKALHIDNENPHIKYNLGVLYYKKDEIDRALTLIRNARKLDPTFKEANQALEKLDAEKRKSLGMEWFDWWFKKDTKKKLPIRDNLNLRKVVDHWNIREILKRVVIFSLVAIMIVSIGKLAFDLYGHDLYNIYKDPATYRNQTTGAIIMHHHDIDENAFLIIFAIVTTIAMLPFINRLKMGDVEIEVESAGYRPVGPASVSSGLSMSQIEDQQSIRLGFFLPPFWVYNINEN